MRPRHEHITRSDTHPGVDFGDRKEVGAHRCPTVDFADQSLNDIHWATRDVRLGVSRIRRDQEAGMLDTGFDVDSAD
jgi:hypothetical protein